MVCITSLSTWWRHQMETLSALLAFCAGNSPVFGEFPTQRPVTQSFTWWRHQMETLSVLLAFCAGNSLMTGEFPTQRHVTQSFGVFFDLRLNNRLGKQSCYWWLETPSCPLWRHLNDIYRLVQRVSTVPIFFHCTPHRFPHGFYNLRKSENFSHVIVLSRIHLCYTAMVYNSIAQHSCAYIYIYICVCVCLCINKTNYPISIIIKFPDYPWSHDDVIKWKHFPRYWPFVRGIDRSPANSPQKGQWRGALMFSLICVWINDWVNNREAGDLRHYRAHYDVIVMICCFFPRSQNLLLAFRNSLKCDFMKN